MTGRYSASKKLLVLGLDAATPSLLRSWAADRTLPNIADLMATGLVGATRSVEGMDGSTWPTFYTGLNPAGHGMYWIDQLKTGTYRTQRSRPSDFGRRKAFWEVISDAGHRVLVLDVPLSRRSPGLNGMQVIEWGAHDAFFGFATTPPGLRRTILRTFGRHPSPTVCDVTSRSLAEYREFADQLMRGAELRARLTRRLLSEQPWDFAIQVFTEGHCAGHQLWHFHDPAHPAFDADLSRTTGDLLREVYVSMDRAVGAILSDLEPRTTVVLLVLHSMSYLSGASLLLPEILARLGVMTPAGAPSSDAPSPGPGALVRALRAAYHLVPIGPRRRLYEARHRLLLRWLGRGESVPIDPARTRCFVLDVGRTFAGIRLNLRGREPFGTLEPGTEADRFCEELIRDLREIIRPETGRPLARDVFRTADRFRGAYLDELPDLLVEWDLEHPVGTTVAGTGAGAVVRATSPRIGTIEGRNTYCRTGDHRFDGLFVARGPGIAPGKLDRVASNLDLAPSLVRFMGAEMPGVDGQPIPELVGTSARFIRRSSIGTNIPG